MKHERWKSYLIYRKHVPCKREGMSRCNYMAMLTWERGKPKATGICTKCGFSWTERPPSDRELGEDLIHE